MYDVMEILNGPTCSYLGHGGSLIVLAAVFIGAYLIGNISPSILLGKMKGIDIKQEGSGNAGTTNALRVLGKKAGAITFVIDILKGTVAVMMGGLFAGTAGEMWCVIGVFCGHVWPVFFGFRGGKGVATAFGALLALNPLMALTVFGVVLVAVLLTKRMSVGSILGALSFPFISFFMERDFIGFGIILAAIIIIKHKANIVRIFKGEEPVMSIFVKDKDQEEK